MSHDCLTVEDGVTSMTHGFQQQDTGYGYAPPKQAATQQHGQKAAEKPLPIREPRTYRRPGH
jgi:hypothetical protein